MAMEVFSLDVIHCLNKKVMHIWNTSNESYRISILI